MQSTPYKAFLFTCVEAFLAGLCLFVTLNLAQRQDPLFILGIVAFVFFVYKITNSLIRLRNFVNIMASILDTLMLYIFDGNQDDVNKTLGILASSKSEDSVEEIIHNAIRKTKFESKVVEEI